MAAALQRCVGPPARSFGETGFQIVPELVPAVVCDELAHELTVLFEREQGGSKTRIGGVRNLLQASRRVCEFATAIPCGLASELLGRCAFPVRAIFFDKTAEANWRVPWHQDLTIAVAERIESPGFGPWSVKDGVVHVQPPIEILEGMVTIRLHLDDCGPDNGALRVIPGSHKHKALPAFAIDRLVESEAEIRCVVPKGGALAMRPLLLHASSPALKPSHRRVLHLEYASGELPGGLVWLHP